MAEVKQPTELGMVFAEPELEPKKAKTEPEAEEPQQDPNDLRALRKGGKFDTISLEELAKIRENEEKNPVGVDEPKKKKKVAKKEKKTEKEEATVKKTVKAAKPKVEKKEKVERKREKKE